MATPTREEILAELQNRIKSGHPDSDMIQQALSNQSFSSNPPTGSPDGSRNASGDTTALTQQLPTQSLKNDQVSQYANQAMHSQSAANQQPQQQYMPNQTPEESNGTDINSLLKRLQVTPIQGISNAMSVLGGGKPIYDPNMANEFLKQGGALKYAMAPYQQAKLGAQANKDIAQTGAVATTSEAAKARAAAELRNAGLPVPQELMPGSQGNGQPAVQGTQGLSGQDYINNLASTEPDLAQALKGIGEYRTNITQLLGRGGPGAKQHFLSAIQQAYPDFDQKTYEAQQKYQSDLASGKTGQSITAINTVIPHVQRLSDSLQALSNGQIPALNAVRNWWTEQTGGGGPKRAETDLVAVSNEIENAYRQTGGTEEGIRAWRKGQPDINSSPDQQRQWVQEGMGLLQSRLDSLGGQYQQVMGKEAPQGRFIFPQNQQIIQKLGGQGQPQATQGSQSLPFQHQAPPGAVGWSKSRNTWVDANGNPIQ